MFMPLACLNNGIICKNDLVLARDARSLLQFRHILFIFHLLNRRRDRETPVELAHLNFNIQARQVKAFSSRRSPSSLI
jgi:hypothetical protein